MSRLRKAMITASFGYLQYALALVSGIVLVPLVLRDVGPRSYGLWLASGELLGYAGMVDLGVLGVLPWMFAEAEGRGDRTAMRRLLANGVVLGALTGVLYVAVALLLWTIAPAAFSLSEADRHVVARPLACLAVATMVASPFKVFGGLLEGVQDATFNGRLAASMAALGVMLTALLLSQGAGLMALAAGAAVPTVVSAAAVVFRARRLVPELFTGWPRPSWRAVAPLLTSGVGVWLSGCGWRLVAASNGLVIASLGRPEWVAVYACTSKLSAMATQIAWILPDAGLIPLAQVSGEQRDPVRVRSVVSMMLRLHLLLSGGATCALLVANPAFVSLWVGPDLFGGLALNALVATGIVATSFVHGLLTAASVLGARVQVGVVTLVHGAVQVGAAWVLGHLWGLPGIAAAGLAASALIALPFGMALLGPVSTLRASEIWADIARPWVMRAVPLAAAAVAIGTQHAVLGLSGLVPLAICVGVAYLWQMRPLYARLAVDPRIERWLASLRLLPPRQRTAY